MSPKLPMPLSRILKVFTAIALLLLLVEKLKGHAWGAAFGFALLWSGLATGLFLLTGYFYRRRGIDCALCNDLSSERESEQRRTPQSGSPSAKS